MHISIRIDICLPNKMAVDFRIDPKTTNFSNYSHVLGNNEFDADMDIVESFVSSYQDPENELAQSAVFYYYISRLFHYWNFTLQYVQNDQIIKDLQKTSTYTGNRFSDSEMATYGQSLLDYIQTLTTEFIQTRKVNIIAIQNAFAFVSKVLCFMSPDFDIGPTSDKMYPLPNIVGLFGLNTYLYAFFEGIYLLGVPTKTTNFDAMWGCPYIFVDHDIFHSDEIISRWDRQSLSLQYNKVIYYTILNDPSLSTLSKECHITNMWVDLHELSGRKIKRFHPNFLIRTYSEYESLENIQEDFYPLYISFISLTFSSENIEALNSYDRNLTDQSLKLWKEIYPQILAEQQTGKYTFIHLYILARWYTIRYLETILSSVS